MTTMLLSPSLTLSPIQSWQCRVAEEWLTELQEVIDPRDGGGAGQGWGTRRRHLWQLLQSSRMPTTKTLTLLGGEVILVVRVREGSRKGGMGRAR